MINKKHKDRLFRKIFGYEKYKENLLSLYNALNDTDYMDVNDLVITTIDDVIYMGMKNDVSCILDSRMSLYEQQSTFNPNMPVRGLMYFGKLYNKYIKKNRLNIYGSRQIKIPTPQYYVFYNGTEDYPDKMILKLSDAFQKENPDGGFEWTAVMLNINFGKNKKLMERCKLLREYAILVDNIRKYQKTYADAEEAVTLAIDECIENGVLVEFLLEHKAEVVDMCLTEYNEEETMEMFKEEARAEGREEGRQLGKVEGVMDTLISLVEDGLLPVEKAAERMNVSVEQFEQQMKNYSRK